MSGCGVLTLEAARSGVDAIRPTDAAIDNLFRALYQNNPSIPHCATEGIHAAITVSKKRTDLSTYLMQL